MLFITNQIRPASNDVQYLTIIENAAVSLMFKYNFKLNFWTLKILLLIHEQQKVKFCCKSI